MMAESAEKIETYTDSIEQTEKQLENTREMKVAADKKLSEAEEATQKSAER